MDAHDDVLTPFSTRSGNLHGCPVSPLLGWGEKEWRELKHFDWAFDRKYLPPGQASFVQAKTPGLHRLPRGRQASRHTQLQHERDNKGWHGGNNQTLPPIIGS